MKPLWPLLLLALTLPVGAARQTQTSSEGILVGIESSPERVPAGGVAKFEGAVFVGEGLADRRVEVKVVDPAGRITSAWAHLLPGGAFNFSIPDVREGIYRVTFRGVDGRNPVEREFRVEDLVRTQQILKKKAEDLQAMADQVAERARARVERAPAGPHRDEAVRRVARIHEERRRVTEGVQHILSAAEAVASLKTDPDLQGPAMECLSDLTAWADSTDREAEELKAFEHRTRSDPGVCDSLETAAEGLKFVASATSLLLKPLDLLKSAITNQVVPRAAAKNPPPNPDVRFAVDRARQEAQAAWNGMDSIVRSLPAFSHETSAFVIEKLVKHYCSILEGPVQSDFSVYVPEKGKLFWSYKLQLKGTVRLVAEKNKPATAEGVEYHGRIEGGASKVEFKEDIFAVEPLPRGSKLVLRKVVTPPVLRQPGGDLLGTGQAFRTATPGHFNISVTGMLSASGMKVRQERVVDDFSPLFRNRVGIVAITPGVPMPVVKSFEFPMQKAAWILERTTRGPFELPRVLDGDKLHVKGEFERHEQLASGIKVDWKTSYEAVGER